MLTDGELEGIEGRLAAATPGPWGCYDAYDIPATSWVGFHRLGTPTAEGIICADPQHDLRAVKADIEMIADAPADMRALLDDVKVLRGLLAEARLYVACEAIMGEEPGARGAATELVQAIDAALQGQAG